jgi:3D (Asp-Asp-Asp) domain-containing protein
LFDGRSGKGHDAWFNLSLMPRFAPGSLAFLLLLLAAALLLGGCAADYGVLSQQGLTAANRLMVRTTAYTGRRNAIGQRLQFGKVISAASDWSQFPVGTRFRIRQTGQQYVIDDYGSALVGTRTIDLAMPNDRAMHQWGVRQVEIEVLEWGSPRRSLEILTPREHVGIVRRMVAALRKQAGGMPQQFHRLN